MLPYVIDRPRILAALEETKENSPLSFDLLSKSYLSKHPGYLIRRVQHHRHSKSSPLRNKHHLRGEIPHLLPVSFSSEFSICSCCRAITTILKDLLLQHLCMRTILSAKGPGPFPWATDWCPPHRLSVLDFLCTLPTIQWVLQVSRDLHSAITYNCENYFLKSNSFNLLLFLYKKIPVNVFLWYIIFKYHCIFYP